MTFRRITLSVGVLALAWFAAPVCAAIVGPGDGTQNTVAPANTSAFDNVARYRVGSAVYLGDRWLLTAHHVYGGIDTDPVTFTDGGPAYSQVGSGIQLQYPGPGGGPTDLTLIRIATDPGLPQIQVGATPTAGTAIVMAGFGRNRASELTRWNGNTKPWAEVEAGGNHVGYKYAAGTTKRWATNVVDVLTEEGSVLIEGDTESHLGKAVLFGASFTRSGGTQYEGIVGNGDSGGAVFANNRLIGLPLYLDTFENQPAQTAVYGNLSFFANLASYVDQIATITGLHPGTDGDANLDGAVDSLDFDILKEHFGQQAGWTGGDFTLNGRVDFADFQVLERNFAGAMPLPPDTGQMLRDLVGVPEPASALLLVMGAALLPRRRRPV